MSIKNVIRRHVNGEREREIIVVRHSMNIARYIN